MKKVLFIIFAILMFSFAAVAQDAPPTPQTDPAKRPNLLRELGLSPEQVQTIRTINQAQKPKMELAQRNFRQARKALDDAVYAEEFVETDVQAKNKVVQIAQAEITKVKTETEVAIRKVLTPEQLVKFRELRQRLIESNMPKNRPIMKQMKQMKQRFPNRQPQ
jgi:Spy/CpxP family protein refolding chaperone